MSDRSSAGVVGIGATGARAARQLASSDGIARVVLDGRGDRPELLRGALGDRAIVADPFEDPDVGVVVLATAVGSHVAVAERAIAAGRHVVSTSDDPDEVAALVGLGDRARAAGVAVVVGAAFAPGMTCLLAAHVARWMDEVDEIHVARFGTGGPACARSHHRALSSRSEDRRDGDWVSRPGGSGRELCAFPDPVGSLDCYRAGLPDARLLHAAFPAATRITARQAANRRQRLTAWLPMLRRPHPEGRIGAIRVEVRGRRGPQHVVEVVGALDRPAVAAGAVAGLAARWTLQGAIAPGASSLADVDDTVGFLHGLAELGVRAAVFTGSD